MTTDEIFEMARQAGFEKVIDINPNTGIKTIQSYGSNSLEAFAKLVAAKATDEANTRANTSWTLMCKKMVEREREACAKVCDGAHPNTLPAMLGMQIRARGEEQQSCDKHD